MESDMDWDFSRDMYCGLVERVFFISHVGPIRTFVLRVTCPYRYDDMNTWLQFVSRNGIEDLRIIGDEHVDGLSLPQYIFQCLGLSCLTLRKITLYSPLPFRGFPNLTKLILYDVNIAGDMLEQVISRCPLEVLFIERCCFYPTWPDFHFPQNAISAPNLRILRVVCSRYGLDRIWVKYTPNLRVASFTIDKPEEIVHFPSNCHDVLRSMPKIEVLTFQCHLHNPDIYEKSFISEDSLTAATAYLDVVNKEKNQNQCDYIIHYC